MASPIISNISQKIQMDTAELAGWVSPARLALGLNEVKQRLRSELSGVVQ